jgi:hypothetical protein
MCISSLEIAISPNNQIRFEDAFLAHTEFRKRGNMERNLKEKI